SPFTEPVAAAEANTARITAAGGRGVVLRFGMFQAAGSAHTDAIVGAARKGVLLDRGRDDRYAPCIDIDDAARAGVRGLDSAARAYDGGDDPITRREMARALAAAIGRRRLRRPPGAGAASAKAGPLGDSQRVSNRAFRDATGWRPRVHDQAESLTRLIDATNV